MARIKGGLNAKKKHNRVLKLAKGYRGARSKQYRVAKQSVMRALTSSYAGRKERKRQFRQFFASTVKIWDYMKIIFRYVPCCHVRRTVRQAGLRLKKRAGGGKICKSYRRRMILDGVCLKQSRHLCGNRGGERMWQDHAPVHIGRCAAGGQRQNPV